MKPGDAARILAMVKNLASNGSVIAINTQSGTSYSLALSDAGGLVRMTAGSGSPTVTLPPSSSVAYPTGSYGQVEQAGSATVTFAAGSGVTIHSPAGMLSIASQYGRVTWVYLGSNVYAIEGRLRP